MSKPKDDPTPAKARRPAKPADDEEEEEGERYEGTVEGAESPDTGPGVDPSTGAPTPAAPGESVAAVHAVHPGPHHVPGTDAEVHPPVTAGTPAGTPAAGPKGEPKT